MEVLHPRCAGLDVHKDGVVAAVRIAAPGGGASVEVRRFETTTPGLLALGEWLAECGCTHAAMEATGVYWWPVWHVLSDGDLTLILANAAHVKNVPGRKTDVADAAWLAELLAHGLIRPSFVPEPATAAMRALMRTRKQLVREGASHVQRLQKVLEDANLKLASVLSDIVGVSGRAILEALIAGEADPDRLLALVHRRVKAEPGRLRAALTGRLTDHHRFLLRLHLRQTDAIDAALAEIDAEVERDLGPFRDAVRLLRSIPGVSDLSAQAIVAEIGTDMGRFPTAGHLLAAVPPTLGRPLPPQRRERRQAPLHPPAQGRALAQDHPRPVRLGRQPQEGQLPARPVHPTAPAPRPQEGDLRRRRVHPHRRLAHAPQRHLLERPRPRPLPPQVPGAAGQAPRRPDRQTRLHLLSGAHRQVAFCLERFAC
jgi:transposase